MGFINSLIRPFAEQIPENNRLELIWKLALVDFKRRYYNTRLGLVWALINPLFQLGIYLFVFTWLGNLRSENFGFYIFSAIILWMSFSECTNQSLILLRSKAYLIQNVKVHIPDLFLSKTLSVFMGLSFNLLAYISASLIGGIPVFWEIIWIPLLLINHFVICYGASMILATIGIYAKDVGHLWVMLVMLGFWTIPAIFPLESFTGKLEILLYVNPVAGIIINTRNALLYGNSMDYSFLIHCLLYGGFLLFLGQFLIRRNWQMAIEYE